MAANSQPINDMLLSLASCGAMIVQCASKTTALLSKGIVNEAVGHGEATAGALIVKKL